MIPSTVFTNASDFFDKMDIPYFKGYKFEIFDDYALNSEQRDSVDKYCFKSGFYLSFSYLTYILIIALIMM